MVDESNPMKKFKFLLGSWNLESNIPESRFSKKMSGKGFGEFKYLLNDKFVSFDYKSTFSGDESGAHAVFVWDEKCKLYRYWWFENSGAFMEATCEFIDNKTLCLNWHNSVLVQRFVKINKNKVLLHMEYPSATNKYDVVLEVVLTRKKTGK